MVEFFQSYDKNIETKIRLVLKSRVHLFLGEAKVSVWCLGFFYLIHRIFRKCDPRILFWQIRVQGFFSCNANKYNIVHGYIVLINVFFVSTTEKMILLDKQWGNSKISCNSGGPRIEVIIFGTILQNNVSSKVGIFFI